MFYLTSLLPLPLPPRLALSSVEGRIVPPVPCGLYFTACDNSCWDGRFLVVGFLGQGGHSHCLPGAQHLEAGEAQTAHSAIKSLKGSWRKEQLWERQAKAYQVQGGSVPNDKSLFKATS